MVDVTLETSGLGSETDVFPTPVHHNRRYNGYLSKPYAEYTPGQQLQIESHRLKFLKDCKSCKRPHLRFELRVPLH